MDYEPSRYVESQQYPFGPGMLYNTGLIARILPNGTLDFLEENGRRVLTDGARGRVYYDLKQSEELLLAQPEIAEARCYMAFDTSVNEMTLNADIRPADGASAGSLDTEALQERIREAGGDLAVPKFIHIV